MEREYKEYRRTQIAEMAEVDQEQIDLFKIFGILAVNNVIKVSISQEDLKNGSPKIGDMIARNPKNPYDQWLVAEQYFKDNFEQK